MIGQYTFINYLFSKKLRIDETFLSCQRLIVFSFSRFIQRKRTICYRCRSNTEITKTFVASAPQRALH